MMASLMGILSRYRLQLGAVTIAVALWFQVHGQGEGSVSFDVPLQLEGLPADMAIVNDLPDHVRITVKGLQSRLQGIRQQTLTMPLNVSDITTPGVVVRALQLKEASIPVGLRIEKVQPDRLELQVDRIVTRSVPLRAHFELSAGWQAHSVTINPSKVDLVGPEVWLDSLTGVETTPIRPELKGGPFGLKAGVESPSGKAIRMVNSKIEIDVKGELLQTVPPKAAGSLAGDKQ